MLSFLRQSRKFLNTADTCIVIGNESCDLDSACSALCLAFFYQQHAIEAQKLTKAKQFLPVLNIPRRDYPLKTEVSYLLKKYEISENMLTFRDELESDLLLSSDFILVDHHVSPFTSRCVAVFDHRPKDESANFQVCKVNLELVGSCATLIGEAMLNAISDKSCITALRLPFHLLRSTIILDTVNFEPAAARSTPKDQKICCCLEEFLQEDEKIESRDEVFQNLRLARADIGSLTAAQLLRKDLKLLKTANGTANVALPGFPFQVQKFIDKPDAEEAVKAFAAENDCDLILLLGMFVNSNGLIERDIGLINLSKNNATFDGIENELLTSSDPTLQLEKIEDCKFLNGSFYKQLNIKATRKHIFPIVRNALEPSKES